VGRCELMFAGCGSFGLGERDGVLGAIRLFRYAVHVVSVYKFEI